MFIDCLLIGDLKVGRYVKSMVVCAKLYCCVNTLTGENFYDKGVEEFE
jgi:hypothetical protein